MHSDVSYQVIIHEHGVFGRSSVAVCIYDLIETVGCILHHEVEHLLASLCSFSRYTISMCLCTIVGRSREDCRHAASLQRDCAKASQLHGMTLAKNTEPMGVQSVWPAECAWDTATCGCTLAFRNAPDDSSSKSKISLEGNDTRKLCI